MYIILMHQLMQVHVRMFKELLPSERHCAATLMKTEFKHEHVTFVSLLLTFDTCIQFTGLCEEQTCKYNWACTTGITWDRYYNCTCHKKIFQQTIQILQVVSLFSDHIPHKPNISQLLRSYGFTVRISQVFTITASLFLPIYPYNQALKVTFSNFSYHDICTQCIQLSGLVNRSIGLKQAFLRLQSTE